MNGQSEAYRPGRSVFGLFPRMVKWQYAYRLTFLPKKFIIRHRNLVLSVKKRFLRNTTAADHGLSGLLTAGTLEQISR